MPPPPPAAPEQPQLHGVVIISLPPPDQPSKGKTITAFTYSDDPAAPTPPPPPAPAILTAAAEARRSRRVLSPRRVAAMVLVLGALAVAAYYCLYSDVTVQFLGMEEEAQKERNETKSFLLPLYPKTRQGRALREFGDVKLAARRVDDDGDRKASNKLEVKKTVAAGMNPTALLPIKGNVFPAVSGKGSVRSPPSIGMAPSTNTDDRSRISHDDSDLHKEVRCIDTNGIGDEQLELSAGENSSPQDSNV